MFRLFTIIAFLILALPQFSTAQDLYFVPNQGQWQESFVYKVNHPNATIYIESFGMTVVVGDEENAAKIHQYKEQIIEEPSQLNYHAYQIKWIGSQISENWETKSPLPFHHNYFLGNDVSRWQSEVKLYQEVIQKSLYKGVDLVYKFEEGNLKYDLIVQPGEKTDNIRFGIHGVDDINIKRGHLMIETSVGEIVEKAPYAYQMIRGQLKKVAAKFELNEDKSISYSFPKGYNKSYPLIIDPEIIFASMTGSTADNWGFSATYDEQGHLYAGGIANDNGYPTSLGAYQLTYGGGDPTSTMPCDITISKFSPNGTSLVYSTYLGGDGDEMPHSLIVDNQGHLIVAGKSNSTDYPVTSNAFQSQKTSGYDIVLTKFNAAGSQLLASSYLGGNSDDGVNVSISYYGDQSTLKYNYGDGFRSEVLVDQQNNIYLAGSTKSSNFPITANAAKSTLGGSQDGVFVKMNPQLSQMIYSTYIGGSNTDAAYVIALNQAQNLVYVAGGTTSSDFHSTTMTGLNTQYLGGISDGFVLKFQNQGSYNLVEGTFIGTSAYDQVYGIEVDLNDQVYVMGQTTGAFPVSTGVYNNPNSTQFVMKMPPNLNQVTYSTVFGSGAAVKPNISPVAFLVDTCENVYISGWASPSISPGTTTANMPITANAFQSTTDNADFYFIVFSKNAENLLLGSYFGANGKMEHVDGGTSRFDRKGVVYQSMCASCGSGNNFPATPGAYASVKGHSNCNLGVVKIAFNLGSVEAEAVASPFATGCAPLEVQFENLSSNATEYFWDFDDGNSSTAFEPIHTFTQPGTYQVQLIAHNPNACKEYDTTTIQIIVDDNAFEGDFETELFDLCTNPYVVIDLDAVIPTGINSSEVVFSWDFGDGSFHTGMNPPNHYYPNPGNYTITLTMEHDDVCNSPFIISKDIEMYPFNVEAAFSFPNPVCKGTLVNFENLSQNGNDYTWKSPPLFENNDFNTSYTFNEVGTYSITLVAENEESCNLIDQVTYEIEVIDHAHAAFDWTPNPPELNKPLEFINLSTSGTSYHWDFGDGLTSTEEHPTHTYYSSGTYQVCLTSSFDGMCPDKSCRPIKAHVKSVADLPTGFSPNGDGDNDVLYVRGYNIKNIHLQIFNRWGQMIFESFDVDNGWDGTYQNAEQPMEVYGYVLQVEFLDGTSGSYQGNVTLLR